MKFQELFSHIGQIEAKLGYVFSSHELLARAFVHRSFLNEHKEANCLDNEKLEFLGDSVLNLLVAEYLFQALPNETEGKLSSLRANSVSSSACIRYFEQLQLQEYILVGRGEELQAGKGGRSSIIADMFEALLGAIYLDGGLEKARRFFMSHFQKTLEESLENPEENWKARLQEHLQKNKQKMPSYKVLAESGPDHLRHFLVGVYLEDTQLAVGSGSSKKEAERNAAKSALDMLRENL